MNDYQQMTDYISQSYIQTIGMQMRLKEIVSRLDTLINDLEVETKVTLSNCTDDQIIDLYSFFNGSDEDEIHNLDYYLHSSKY